MYKKKPCLFCGKETNNKSFCSVSCSKKYNWAKKNSPYRTKKYLTNLSEKTKEWIEEKGHPKGMLGKHHKKDTFNRLKGEKNPLWKGSRNWYNKQARELKKNIKSCEICGSKKNLNVHHKDKNWKNNSLDNLIRVCKHHHRLFHFKEYENKLREGYKQYQEERKELIYFFIKKVQKDFPKLSIGEQIEEFKKLSGFSRTTFCKFKK